MFFCYLDNDFRYNISQIYHEICMKMLCCKKEEAYKVFVCYFGLFLVLAFSSKAYDKE